MDFVRIWQARDESGAAGYARQPRLYHYGRNWQVPSDGPFALRVRVEAPDFPRHDKINGKRFEQPVQVEFPDIRLSIGQSK